MNNISSTHARRNLAADIMEIIGCVAVAAGIAIIAFAFAAITPDQASAECDRLGEEMACAAADGTAER